MNKKKLPGVKPIKNMNRKEKKTKAETKRVKLAEQIINHVLSWYNKSEDFKLSLQKGDEYIQGLILKQPQDKTLIESAAYRIHDSLLEFIEKLEPK